MSEIQLAADQRLAQGTTQCDLAISRQIDSLLPERPLGQTNAEWRLLLTGGEQTDGARSRDAPPRLQRRLELADLNAVEIEQQRGVDVLEGLLSRGEGTITHHQKTVGLRLIQVSTQNQAKVTAAPGQRQGIAGGGRQEAQGIAMAFELKIQRVTQIQRDAAAHLKGFGSTVTAEREVEKKPIRSQHNGLSFKAKGLLTEARLFQGQLRGQQRAATRQVVGARGTDGPSQCGRNGGDQSQKRERQMQKAEASLAALQGATQLSHNGFELKHPILIFTIHPQMRPGLCLQRERCQIRTGKVENSVEATAKVTWINTRLGMIPVVDLQPLTRPLKSTQMPFQASPEGVDHQRAEILSAAKGASGGELAATELLSHLHQPGHIQSGGLDPAAQLPAHASLGCQLNITLLGLQPTAGLETTRGNTSLQLDPLQGNPAEFRVIQMQITDQLHRFQRQNAVATETSLQWT